VMDGNGTIGLHDTGLGIGTGKDRTDSATSPGRRFPRFTLHG
jgi:hypothetical protein